MYVYVYVYTYRERERERERNRNQQPHQHRKRFVQKLQRRPETLKLKKEGAGHRGSTAEGSRA